MDDLNLNWQNTKKAWLLYSHKKIDWYQTKKTHDITRWYEKKKHMVSEKILLISVGWYQ